MNTLHDHARAHQEGLPAGTFEAAATLTRGFKADAVTLPQGCKDLGPVVSSQASSSSRFPTFLPTLFQ